MTEDPTPPPAAAPVPTPAPEPATPPTEPAAAAPAPAPAQAAPVVPSANGVQLVLAARQLIVEAERFAGLTDRVSWGMAVSLAQDGCELVLRAVVDAWEVTLKKDGFTDIINAVDAAMVERTKAHLPGKHVIERLNKARISFKHYGLMPDGADCRSLVPQASDFVDDVCEQAFGIDPRRLSLVDLIEDAETREHLIAALDAIDGEKSNLMASVRASAIAFKLATARVPLLIRARQLPRSPYSGTPEMQMFDALRGALEAFTHDVGDYSLATSLRLHPVDLARFRQLTPSVSKDGRGEWHTVSMRAGYREEEARFCVEFATDAALTLQRSFGAPRSPGIRPKASPAASGQEGA